ncbi:hypothetical protein BDZ97DRAFT_1763542 [Flammula alnicola]|nr:hypothetical protein BDZ97DRAFT_1763542 [Flammula alnicola]
MSSVSCVPPNGVNLGLYDGVQQITMCMTMALWGVTCMQTRSNDGLATRALDYTIVCYGTYSMSLKGGRHGSHMLIDGWKLQTDSDRGKSQNRQCKPMSFFVKMLVALPTQFFFSSRVYRFGGGHWWFPVLLAPLILFQIVVTGFLYNSPSSLQIIPVASTQALLFANIAVGAGTDVIICVSLFALLWKRYSTLENSHFKAIAIVTIAMVLAFPSNYIYVAFSFAMSPIYCNTLLANLNARDYVRNVEPDETVNLSALQTTGCNFQTQVSTIHLSSRTGIDKRIPDTEVSDLRKISDPEAPTSISN